MFWLRKRVKVPLKITIQISGLGYEKQMQLLKKLYLILKQDKYWHFFFEPDLIIRMSDARLVVEVSSYLKKYDYLFDTYDYPYTEQAFHEQKQALKMLHLLIPVWHSHSEAVMTLKKDKDKKLYFDRVYHTCLNMMGIGDLGEAKTLLRVGMGRLELFEKNFNKMMIGTRRNRA